MPAASSAEIKNRRDVDRELAEIAARNGHVDEVRDDEAGNEPERRRNHDAREHRGLLAPVRRKERAKPFPVDAPLYGWFLGLIDVRPHQPVAGHHP